MRKFGDDNMFVKRVGSFAHTSHAIEGRDADAGGEVSVGASAYRGFF